MNKRILSVIGLVSLGLLLFWGSTAYAQSRWTATGGSPHGMMDNWSGPNTGRSLMGGGMMNGGIMHGGMMGNGIGMMPSMHGGWGGLTNVEPLSLEEAKTAVTGYLAALNRDDLALGEIMIFANHAYAQIRDTTTGQGAFEVLVDPITRNVLSEPGPNMMWNTEYGMMNGVGNFGMMGGGMIRRGMWGGYGYAVEVEVSVTAAEAVDIAQRYLAASLPGTTADTTVDPFPGYYTLHLLEDGNVTGMLSVNAYTGQVFLHSWHGDFVEMVDGAH